MALNWLYQDRHLGWLALVFASDRPEEVDRQITHWLQALQQTTPEQQQHYYQLSRRRFQALSPLDQLRQRAFGFAPARRPPGSPIFAPPCKSPRRSAWPVKPFPQGSLLPPRALACRLAAGAAALSLTRRWRSLSIRRPLASSLPNARRKPRRCSISRHREIRRGSCCDRPSTARPIRPRGWRVGEQLRPLLAALRPCRGDTASGICRRQLAVDPPAAGARPTAGGDPAGHPAAARAPGRLADPTAGKYRYPLSHGSTPRTAGYIRASGRLAGGLAGGSAEDAKWVARQLSLITAPVNPPMPAPAPCRRGVERLVYPGGDTALLVFIPLPDGASLAALRLLAQHCEPLFSSACGWSSRLAMW